jgi:thiol-disulfide isomerase/thioredoxin
MITISGCGHKDEQQSDVKSSADTKTVDNNHTDKNKKRSNFRLSGIVPYTDIGIRLKDEKIEFRHLRQPIVLINLFATWCPPCKSQIPSLSQLQKNHSDILFVIGIPVNDNADNNKLREFTQQNDDHFFVSKANTAFTDYLISSLKLDSKIILPMSILYKNGIILRYYEGAIPLEMLENEITQALINP